MKKKIVALTGTRAEYGILKPIFKRVIASKNLELFLIAVGMHLSKDFGYTITDIEKDGFSIYSTIETIDMNDTGKGMANHIGKNIIKMGEVLDKINPDIFLVLGDRSEALAGAVSAACMNLFIVHLHGGEISGSIDNSFRQAITKLAHLHLVATEKSKDNIIKMGEDPSRIFVVGAPGLDEIHINNAIVNNIPKEMGLKVNEPTVLLVQHPVVPESHFSAQQIKETLDAVVELGLQTILIYPNADPGGRRMIKIIKEYTDKYNFIKGFENLPRTEYLSLLKFVDVMVGNSSSGIIEAPSFHLPVVNIGTRQKGRERADNTLEVGYDKKSIKEAIHKSLYDEKFKKQVKKCKNPYYKKNSVCSIIKIMEKISINQEFLIK